MRNYLTLFRMTVLESNVGGEAGFLSKMKVVLGRLGSISLRISREGVARQSEVSNLMALLYWPN